MNGLHNDTETAKQSKLKKTILNKNIMTEALVETWLKLRLKHD